jgi:hypothetical protein
MKKNNVKMYAELLKGNAVKFVERNKKRLVKLGAVILAVVTIAGGILIIYKMNKGPEINNKPAEIVEVKDNKEDKTKLFLEHVEHLKSGVYDVSALVFGEENMRVNETFGESGKDYVVMQGNFKIKYGVDILRVKFDYDFDTEKVILKVPKDAVAVNSVELIGDITEVEKYESFKVKALDIVLPWCDNDEELKEGAIRQLLRNSKIKANEYDETEIQTKANKALKDLVDKINVHKLDYEIEFVDNQSINIKK